MQRLKSWWRDPDFRLAVIVVITSRIVLGVVAWITTTWFAGYPSHAVWAGQKPDMHGISGALLAPFERDDAVYYLSIAHSGYNGAGVTPFFPLYPLAIRVLGTAFGGAFLFAALVISTLSYVAALTMLGKLSRELLGERRGRLALVTVALWPFSWYFAMALTESLFFALSVGTFLALQRERMAIAALLGVLASLTRLQGVLLFLPIAVVAWRSRPRYEIGWALPPVLATAGFYCYLVAAGFHGGFTAGQSGWQQHLATPWQTVADSVTVITQGIHGEEAANLAVVIFGLACLWPARRLGWSYFAYTAASLAVIVFREGAPTPFISAVRFTAVLFPLPFVVATALEHRRLARTGTLLVFALCQVVLFTTDVRFIWVG